MGDQVNLAARLMTAAQPGQIIVSASTAARVERTFDLEEREPVRVKGKAQPQRNFLVQGGRARPTQPTPAISSQLFSRINEVAIGYERLKLAHQGYGQIIAVSGEAGVVSRGSLKRWASERAPTVSISLAVCASPMAAPFLIPSGWSRER
jgi:hypothetical protein